MILNIAIRRYNKFVNGDNININNKISTRMIITNNTQLIELLVEVQVLVQVEVVVVVVVTMI